MIAAPDGAWTQALLAALGTFILEDPTTVACGLLVADGRMGFVPALAGLGVGIAVGDVGLYLLGRLGATAYLRRWPAPAAAAGSAAWLRRNVVLAVLVSRFVPGTRIAAYAGAGAARAPFVRFALTAAVASVAWTALLLWGIATLGEAVLPALGRLRWPVAVALIGLLILLQRRAARRMAAAPDNPSPPERVLSRFELWPMWLFYPPVAIYCLWLGLRHLSLTLPALANPAIPLGGLIGESKSGILDLVSGPWRRYVAPYVVLPPPDGPDAVALVRQTLRDHGLAYPLVAKPDVGQRGAGVWPLRSDEDLRAYLRQFPPEGRILLQTMVGESDPADAPPADGFREAGVLYWRHPDAPRGEIRSLTLKRFPAVRGDGRRRLRDLIRDDPRARHLQHVYFRRHGEALDRIPLPGEEVRLVFAGNHCQGAVFVDGTHLVTPAIQNLVEGVARSMPGFHFGRLDIRFRDLEAFRRGEDAAIVEINGAGAEATHIWDAGMGLASAYRVLFRQYRVLFGIGSVMRRRGHRPPGLLLVARELLAYRRLSRAYPAAR